MAMLEYNELKPRKYIVFEGEPFEVLTSHVFRKQMRKPVNATKLRNLLTGKVVEHSFHQSEKISEAELDSRQVKYLYTNRGDHWFCEASDPSKRFQLDPGSVEGKIEWIKTNSIVDLLSFEGRMIGLNIPIKVELKVTEAAPAVKGNTVQGGSKEVKLETGRSINVPMFVNEGDIIRVNTETGDYVERVTN